MALACGGLGAAASNAQDAAERPTPLRLEEDGSSGCMRCHAGIEPMHPEAGLTCVDCHGGDATAYGKLEAHIAPSASRPTDDRVAGPADDLAWRRFVNPMDLRVASSGCGGCHPGAVEALRRSLHGTTAGHLSDGFYEMGLIAEKRSRYAVFPERNAGAGQDELDQLVQVPSFMSDLPRDELATHYTDLARKECMQCHLWSVGRAVRGRVGFDGEYRGEGCAACHVRYALDGLSESADATIPRNEPGHPARHEMTRAPTTDTCASCHCGDASIGLHFRGLSQLPPGAPGGPDIPGTTDRLLNRVFYIDDPALTPPDVHHERGMHCIDCHTQNDIMGDGRMVGAMEHAVEISCSDCHGTFTEPARLVTERGTPLEHLRREGDEVVLIGKITGARHVVPQVVHVLDPRRPEHNPDAARAMTAEHAQVECYTCHAGWNVNFLGFHFDRNETLTQLDLLTGDRTPGRVTTQEKVFATWKSLYVGLNERGRHAPYLTGFSTMGSVTDLEGARVLDQALPLTTAGLSGMTMIHHQLHSTRPTARSCVECHRSPSTWGLGSVNFRLARSIAFVADRRGVEIVALNRTQLAASVPLSKLVLPDVTCLEIMADPVQGHAQYLFAGEGGRGVHVIDVRDPTRPRRISFVESVGPRGMHLAGTVLYVADGAGGLRSYDVSSPEEPQPLDRMPMFDAGDVHVQWPWAYVADGPGGVCVVDVRAPIALRLVSALAFHLGSAPGKAIGVEMLFQYSRPLVGPDGRLLDERSQARNLCAVLDEHHGLVLVDMTEPAMPVLLYPSQEDQGRTQARGRNTLFRGLALQSHVDLAERQGGQRTTERDYAYLLSERSVGNRASSLEIWDITDPFRPRLASRARAGSSSELLVPASLYNPPFLQTAMLAPGADGVLAMDATISAEPDQVGAFPAIRGAFVVAVESFPLDRMLDEQGRRLKDVSHADSRWLYLSEIGRILDVPASELAPPAPGGELAVAPPHAHARRDSVANGPAAARGGSDPAVTARLAFSRLDADCSGFLEPEEAARFGPAADIDGDGLLTLAELCAFGGGLGLSNTLTAASEPPPAFLATRVDPDGDLALLLDGTDPWAVDADDDGRLARAEMTNAWHAALDLDRDGGLSRAELSRHPGPLRRLRFGGVEAERLFAAADDNADGRVSVRELGLREADWSALDVDRDGYVQLDVQADVWLAERGLQPLPREWPTRQPIRVDLPPVVTVERMLSTFDEDGDGALSRRELKERPDLHFQLDGDGNGAVEAGELQQAVSLVLQGGVEVTADGFRGRWDLDGDGSVEADEVDLAPWLRRRILGQR